MKIHDYSPGNGTFYQLALTSSSDGDMILLWFNRTTCSGVVGANLGRHPWVNYDVLGRQLGIDAAADLAAIQGWLKKTFNFGGALPPGFDETGKWIG